MNFNKLFLSAALCAVAVPSLMAAEHDYSNDHRNFYGYFLYNAEWFSYGFGKFSFANPETGELIYSYADLPATGLYAGAGINGLIYGYEYEFASTMAEPMPTNFISYNVYTGRRQVIAPWTVETMSNFKPHDMTYDVKNNVMYALGYERAKTGLYSVDLLTGEYKLLTEMETGVTLAANSRGVLYTLTSDGNIATVNPNNGNLTIVGSTGLNGFSDSQTMEFDHTTGVLYWAASYNGNDNIELYAIDLESEANKNLAPGGRLTMTRVGEIGAEARMRAMYIPSADDLEAPAVPSDIVGISLPENPLEVTLKWKNPTTTFSGNTLSSLSGVAIQRDGETLTVFTDNVIPGEEMQFTDKTATTRGEYRYDIIAFNDKGQGEKGVYYQFLGLDIPGNTADIKVEASADLMQANVTWLAPAEGYHGGYIDPQALTYTVKRLPDNLVIAENITGTNVTDNNFRRLLNYCYEITATNAEGSTSTKSQWRVMGPAAEVPYSMTLEDEDAFLNNWSLIDYNNDGYSWEISTGMGHSIFGDYEPAVEYIISPTSTGTDLQDADEWLISPPLKVTPGEYYMAKFGIRTLNPESFEILVGPTNRPEGMKTIKEFDVDMYFPEDSDRAGFLECTAPFKAESNIQCVALRLVTPLSVSLNSSSLQINNLAIDLATGVNTVAADPTRNIIITLDGRMLSIKGEFNSAVLYSVSGTMVGNITTADSDISALTPGVYVLNIDGNPYKIMVK